MLEGSSSSCSKGSLQYIWRKKFESSVFVSVKCAAFVSREAIEKQTWVRLGISSYRYQLELSWYHRFIVWFTTCNPNDKGLVICNLYIGPIKFHWRKGHDTIASSDWCTVPYDGRYLVIMFSSKRVRKPNNASSVLLSADLGTTGTLDHRSHLIHSFQTWRH